MRIKRKDTRKLLSQKTTKPGLLVMGLMVAAVSVFVGTSSVANAQPSNMANGYGGGGISIDIGDIIGDNNVIVIIVNYFVGS